MLDVPVTGHAGLGNYGTVWPVVHQQLGISPFIPYGELDVVPQVPTGQPSVAGSDIRIGTESTDVFAAHSGRRYTTTVAVRGVSLHKLLIGATLPAGSAVASVTLDGRRIRGVELQQTNRGEEVTVAVVGGGRGDTPHTVIVRAG